jgi:hypothetical protein
MFLSVRDDQLIGLFAPVAGVAQAQSFSDGITGQIGTVALEIANQSIKRILVLDSGWLNRL